MLPEILDDDHHSDNPTIDCSIKIRPPNSRFAEEVLDDNIIFEEDGEEENSNLGENRDEHCSRRNKGGVEESVDSKIEKFLDLMQLSDDKSLAVSIMRDHFNHLYENATDDYNAPVLLITGGPGVGKSFLVDVFDGISKIMDVGDQMRMALFGSAAVNIDGSSLLALMDIPTIYKGDQQRVTPWKEEKLMKFKQLYNLDKISVIIIDEISTVKPYMLGFLNARLQAACC